MEWRLVLQLTRDLKPILLNLLILGGQEEEAGEDFGQGLLLVEHWDISLEVAEDMVVMVVVMAHRGGGVILAVMVVLVVLDGQPHVVLVADLVGLEEGAVGLHLRALVHLQGLEELADDEVAMTTTNTDSCKHEILNS